MAPFTDNPNAPNNDGETPIYWATLRGYSKIVKILAPLTDNPNAPNKNGKTPIYSAVCKGHIKIVKILAPLTDNLNDPDKYGRTPIGKAQKNKGLFKPGSKRYKNSVEICRFLESMQS